MGLLRASRNEPASSGRLGTKRGSTIVTLGASTSRARPWVPYWRWMVLMPAILQRSGRMVKACRTGGRRVGYQGENSTSPAPALGGGRRGRREGGSPSPRGEQPAEFGRGLHDPEERSPDVRLQPVHRGGCRRRDRGAGGDLFGRPGEDLVPSLPAGSVQRGEAERDVRLAPAAAGRRDRDVLSEEERPRGLRAPDADLH